MSVRYVFNTSGDYLAFVQGKNLFSPDCDWLGFLLNGNEVYQADGQFVGYLLKDDRIARKKNERTRPRRMAPLQPLRPPRPLQPLRRLQMPQLPYPYEDVFEGIKGNITKIVATPDLGKFDPLEGARLIAADQTYIGTISKNRYDAQSIMNEYGPYGGQYSALSIFNQYGKYGGQYSQLSPFNPYSTTPPKIVSGSHVLGHLTANQYTPNRVDINEFLFWLRST